MIDSSPVQNWNGPTDEIRSFRNGIKRDAKNGVSNRERLSAYVSFLMTSAMVLHKSVELVPNSFVIRILLHQSASSPDGPAPPLALTAGLFTKSVSIASNYFG